MPNNTVQVGITADASQLKEQFNSAAQTTLTQSQRMAQAMAQAKVAAEQLGDAYKKMGAMASSGNMQAINAIVEHMEAAESARAVVDELRSSEDRETASLGRNMSARMAASSEIRVFSGNLQGSTRAAGAFLSLLPGMGAAMQAAFPIFGAIALGEIFVDLGRKAYDLYEKYIDLDFAAQKFSDTVNKMGDRQFIDSHSIEVARKRYEATNKAAGYSLTLAQQINKEYQKDVDATGGGALAHLGVFLASITKLKEAGDFNKSGYTSRLQSLALLQKEAPLQHDIARATIEANHALDGELLGHQEINAELRKKLELIAETQRYTAQEDKDSSAGMEMKGLQDRIAEGEAAAANKRLSAQELLKSMEQENARERALHEITLGEEAGYWRKRLHEFEVGSSEYETVVDKVNSAMIAEGNRAAEMIKRGNEKIASAQKESAERNEHGSDIMLGADNAMAKWQKTTSEAILQTGQRWESYHREVARANDIQAKNDAALSLAVVAQKHATGSLTAFSGAEHRAAIHTELFREKLQSLNAELERLRSKQKLDPVTGMNTDPQNAAAQASVQGQIAQTQGQQQLSSISDKTATAQALATPFQKAFSGINSSWLQVQNAMIFGTQRIGIQFQNMGAHMVMGLAQQCEEMLATWAEHEALKLALHLVTGQQMVAQSAAETAQKQAIQVMANQAAVTSSAAVAAAAAAPSGAAAGPAGAAAAAASTFALVEGTYAPLAATAFELGGIVNGMPGQAVPIVAHAGERVLTTGQTKTFESLVNNNNGGNTSSMTVHNHTNFSGITDANFRAMAMKHSDIIGASVRKAHRESGNRTVH